MNLKQRKPSALLATLLTGAGLVVVSGMALAGISNTKHNLSSTQPTAANNHVTNTGDICVFCHTPHGADISNANSNPPLWNKALPATSGYSTYAALNSASMKQRADAIIELKPFGSAPIASTSAPSSWNTAGATW